MPGHPDWTVLPVEAPAPLSLRPPDASSRGAAADGVEGQSSRSAGSTRPNFIPMLRSVAACSSGSNEETAVADHHHLEAAVKALAHRLLDADLGDRADGPRSATTCAGAQHVLEHRVVKGAVAVLVDHGLAL